MAANLELCCVVLELTQGKIDFQKFRCIMQHIINLRRRIGIENQKTITDEINENNF
jgi:hypothetical protein